MVSSIVLVGAADDPTSATAALVSSDLLSSPGVENGRLAGTYRSAAVEIRLVDRASFGSALFEATGNREHVVSVGRRGLAAAPYVSEEALYSSVGLSYIEPELRQATGEVEAAAAGQLPVLVATPNMRGDLHMHTTYSDGRDPLDVMVAGAQALGYGTSRSPIIRQGRLRDER